MFYRAPWFSAMRWITLIIWVGMGLGLLILARMHLEADLFWRCFPFGVALMATGFVSAVTWEKHSWPFVLVLGWAGSLLVLDTLVLPNLPQLQVSRIAGETMAEFRKAHPEYSQGVCNYEDATVVFYSGANVATFAKETLTQEVPFGPKRDPGGHPYMIAVDSETLKMLKAGGFAYTPLARRDVSANFGETEAYSIPGIRAGNPFKPVTITVITNDYPISQKQPAAGTGGGFAGGGRSGGHGGSCAAALKMGGLSAVGWAGGGAENKSGREVRS